MKRLIATVPESESGTFQTCRRGRHMSVVGGIAEVAFEGCQVSF
jgi:hypothetical protein